MASALSVLRLVLHIFAALVLTVSLALCVSSVLTTAWQTYYDSGTQEIHQHGLWYDYTYAKRHMAGKTEADWHWRYKFGQSVEGDEDHRWKSYQYNSLILFCAAAFLSFVSAIMSYMAPYFVSVALVWAFITIWPPFLSLAGVIVFFTTAMTPEYNHVFTDRRLELEIGYSFHLAIAATIMFYIALATVIGAAILDCVLLRRGERPSLRETYLKVSTKSSQNESTSLEVQKQNQITTV